MQFAKFLGSKRQFPFPSPLGGGREEVILQQHDGLCSNLVCCLALLGGVEHNRFVTIQVGVLIEESGTELIAQHILHCTLESFGTHQTLIECFLQKLVVVAMREIHIVAGIDGIGCFLLDIVRKELVDR